MPARNTRTGAVLEAMILPALSQGGYTFRQQVNVGLRPNGRRHFVDAVATHPSGRSVLISLKWQQTDGTAEQKVPFEVMCLSDVIRENPQKFQAAYVVLGGPGWSLRDFYTNQGLGAYLKDATSVVVVSMEDFVARANRGTL